MTALTNWRTWLYGFLSWLIPFVASFLFVGRDGVHLVPQPLFKSLMVVIGGAAGAGLLVLTLRRLTPSLVAGLAVGLLWLVINLVLDFAILVPMARLSVEDYVFDTGLRYVLLPITAVAMSLVAKQGT